MTVQSEQLRACPHFEQVDTPDVRAEMARRGPQCSTICAGCGGDNWEGPSCLCPVYGESEDA